jgi:dolichol kinase
VFINSTQNEKTAALCNTRYPRKTKMQKKAKKAKRTIAGFEPVCPIPLCVYNSTVSYYTAFTHCVILCITQCVNARDSTHTWEGTHVVFLSLAFSLSLVLLWWVLRTFCNRMTPRGTLWECSRKFLWWVSCLETRGVVCMGLAFSEKHITWKTSC